MKQQGALKIVALGDSITLAMRQEDGNKWVDIVQKQLNEKLADVDVTVVNSGVGGNTSREGLERIQADVLDHDPDIVLVEFGGNDPTPTEERTVEIEEFKANIEKIRQLCEGIGARVVLLTFPPVINEWHIYHEHEKYVESGGLDNAVEPYRQFVRDYAAQNGLILIDIDKTLREAGEATDPADVILKEDGVHLTTKGNAVVADAVLAGLSTIEKF